MAVGVKPQLEGALDMMRRVLRDGAPLADEYPLVFREGFNGQVVALGEADGVRSACAILTRDLRIDDRTLRVGLIGSVSTDPAYRHQGLATRVLLEAESQLRARGCMLALLWADDPRFYDARGYRPVGWEVDLAFGAEVADALPEVPSRPLREGDEESVHALYAEHSQRALRSPAETAALLACPGMRASVCERDGRITAYACLGRGRDLAGALHEWGGRVDDVLGLVRDHWETLKASGEARRMFLMAAPGATELCTRLQALGAERGDGILGLGKLLDFDAAAALLARNAGANLDGGRLVGPGGSLELDDENLLELLFSPRGSRELHTALEPELGLDLGALPLAPFLWGLDSI